jgi:hypothetical protein
MLSGQFVRSHSTALCTSVDRHKAALLFRIANVLKRREPHRSATFAANRVKLARHDPLSFLGVAERNSAKNFVQFSKLNTIKTT